MAQVRITSRKIESRNGRAAHLFEGDLHSDKFGVIFSGGDLILNLTNGERSCSVIFNDESTQKLMARFAEFAKSKSSPPDTAVSP